MKKIIAFLGIVLTMYCFTYLMLNAWDYEWEQMHQTEVQNGR